MSSSKLFYLFPHLCVGALLGPGVGLIVGILVGVTVGLLEEGVAVGDVEGRPWPE